MSDPDGGGDGASRPGDGSPSKRRKIDNESPTSTPRRYNSSPDSPDPHNYSSHGDGSLPIRTGRSPSASRSRSRSRVDDDNEGGEKRYYSPSTSSRSRSRSRRRSRSTDGQSDDSRSRSRASSPSSSSSSRRRRRPRRRQQQQQGRREPAKPPPRPAYRRVLELRGHTRPVSQVRISPNSRWIASASADGTARIWDAATGAHMSTLVGHMAGVSCLAWSPDSDTLATGADDKAIRLWDRITSEPAHAVGDGLLQGDGAASEPVPTVVGDGLAQGGRRAVRADNDASGSGARGSRRPLLGHHNYVYCLAFSPKGNILASGSYDEAVFLWDVRAGRLMRSLPAHSDPVSGIDFCRDGTLVVSCSTDGLMCVAVPSSPLLSFSRRHR